MTIAAEIEAERAALTVSMSAAGATAAAGCGTWTTRDLAAHLVAEERFGGLSTFLARALVVRGVAVPAPPRLVDFAIRRERRYAFVDLIARLRRPIPTLLLRQRVAAVTLFEYWTHHDDLLATGAVAHPAPPTLAEAIPPLLRYQLTRLPAGVRVSVCAEDGDLNACVGPTQGPAVLVRGPCADLVRWLEGRCPRTEVTMTGPEPQLRALRAFEGHV